MELETITFDTNCVIDVDEARNAKADVLKLVRAHREGKVDAAFVAVSASERQKGDTYLETYNDFLARLQNLDLEDIPQIHGMAYCDISYWDHALWASPDDTELERRIHEVLFPKIDFNFADFARTSGIEPTDTKSPEAKRWRNAWCDRQMIWSHMHHRRTQFVTSDRNFKALEKQGLIEIETILTPQECVEKLDLT